MALTRWFMPHLPVIAKLWVKFGKRWTATSASLSNVRAILPLLSEQRESQCLPNTTSILSPCRQTKSVLLGCREWLPLIRRTCWRPRWQLLLAIAAKNLKPKKPFSEKKKTPAWDGKWGWVWEFLQDLCFQCVGCPAGRPASLFPCCSCHWAHSWRRNVS